MTLKPTTQDSHIFRKNGLHSEEEFEKGEMGDKVSQKLVQYLKQQNLVAPSVIPEMQRLQNNMGSIWYRLDIGDEERAM